MDVDVVVETVIRAPRQAVAAFAGDPGNAPRWYRNITSVTWRTQAPLRVGSQLDFEATFLGRRLAYTYEVIDLVPGRRLVMRTADGPFPMRTTYTWEDADTPGGDAGTRMTLRNQGRPSGFARLGVPVVERAMRRATTRDLADLAALLER